jgi:hypothetical protein
MKSSANTVEDYIESIDEKWKDPIKKLRNIIKKNIPKGFEETMNYGMIGYVIPKSVYPDGYHSNPKEPVPFINLAAQKNHIAIYHMGLYGKEKLRDWFIKENEKENKRVDIGGSCIRYKKEEDIPYKLIEELVKKVDLKTYLGYYVDEHVKSKK